MFTKMPDLSEATKSSNVFSSSGALLKFSNLNQYLCACHISKVLLEEPRQNHTQSQTTVKLENRLVIRLGNTRQANLENRENTV